MYNNLDLTKVLFLDIETVSEHATYDHLDETFQGLWKLKTRQVLRQYNEPITEEQAVTERRRSGTTPGLCQNGQSVL